MFFGLWLFSIEHGYLVLVLLDLFVHLLLHIVPRKGVLLLEHQSFIIDVLIVEGDDIDRFLCGRQFIVKGLEKLVSHGYPILFFCPFFSFWRIFLLGSDGRHRALLISFSRFILLTLKEWIIPQSLHDGLITLHNLLQFFRLLGGIFFSLGLLFGLPPGSLDLRGLFIAHLVFICLGLLALFWLFLLDGFFDQILQRLQVEIR